MRGFLGRLATVAFMSIAFASTSLAAGGKPHRIAIQVDQNDPQVMNLALNNAGNVIEYYRARKGDVEIDVVAYGPGLHMLRADTSPIKARLAAFHQSMPEVRLSACNNTLRGMEMAEGKKVELMPEATIVPSGVVRLMELQEQGWSYVRP